jgi:hypothetical protein
MDRLQTIGFLVVPLVHISFPPPFFHFKVLVFFALLPFMPLAFDSNLVTNLFEGKTHLVYPLSFFNVYFPTKERLFPFYFSSKLFTLDLVSFHCE